MAKWTYDEGGEGQTGGDSGGGGFWGCGQCFDEYPLLYDRIGGLCGDDASEVGEE